MPRRETKRGAERTPLSGDYDVLICGASFAGLAVARQLAGATRADGSPARVLMIDRYEIGERQTSACGIPTVWLDALGLMGSHRQTFHELRVSTPFGTHYWPLPWTFSTFDYRELCGLLREQSDCEFETAKVNGRTGHTVHTDRGDLTAPLIVDAMGWRRNLAADAGYQPPDAPLSRGLEVHPDGLGPATWPSGSTARSCRRATAGASPPTASCGSAWARSTPASTSRTTRSSWPRTWARTPVRFQGNWIPHKLRDSTEDGIFFAGDSAGHCLPLTAEGIRTALHFGLVCGDELREVRRGHAHARGGAAALPRVQRRARVEVPLDAARPALGPAPAPAPAARPGGRDGPPPAADRLGLPALPAHRRARPRRARRPSTAPVPRRRRAARLTAA